MISGNKINKIKKKITNIILDIMCCIKVGFNESRIPSSTLQLEKIYLYNISSKISPDKSIFEIGSYLGATIAIFGKATNKNKNKLYAVDTWMNETMPEGEINTYKLFVNNIFKYLDRTKIIRKNSFDLTGEDIPSDVGLFFIDGDHSENGIRSDLNKVLSRANIGAQILFHDFSDSYPGVINVITEFHNGRKIKIIGVHGTLAHAIVV